MKLSRSTVLVVMGQRLTGSVNKSVSQRNISEVMVAEIAFPLL